MCVERERTCDAAAERVSQHEFERADCGSSYRVTSTVGDFAEMILDPLGGHVTQERRVVLLLKGDHRDVGYVAFVSSPPNERFGAASCPVSTYWMCGVTNASDMSVDSIATVSFADLNTPPPPAGPFV